MARSNRRAADMKGTRGDIRGNYFLRQRGRFSLPDAYSDSIPIGRWAAREAPQCSPGCELARPAWRVHSRDSYKNKGFEGRREFSEFPSPCFRPVTSARICAFSSTEYPKRGHAPKWSTRAAVIERSRIIIISRALQYASGGCRARGWILTDSPRYTPHRSSLIHGATEDRISGVRALNYYLRYSSRAAKSEF